MSASHKILIAIVHHGVAYRPVREAKVNRLMLLRDEQVLNDTSATSRREKRDDMSKQTERHRTAASGAHGQYREFDLLIHIARTRGRRAIAEILTVQGFDSTGEECRLHPIDL